MDLPWESIFRSFKITSRWTKVINLDKPKHKLNECRTVEINDISYFEVKTQNPEINFLINVKHYKHLKNHTWRSIKIKNTYQIATDIINKNGTKTILYFHN